MADEALERTRPTTNVIRYRLIVGKAVVLDHNFRRTGLGNELDCHKALTDISIGRFPAACVDQPSREPDVSAHTGEDVWLAAIRRLHADPVDSAGASIHLREAHREFRVRNVPLSDLNGIRECRKHRHGWCRHNTADSHAGHLHPSGLEELHMISIRIPEGNDLSESVIVRSGRSEAARREALGHGLGV